MRSFPLSISTLHALVAVLLALLIPGTASASSWESEERDCGILLRSATELDRMERCMVLWVSYSSSESLTQKERKRFGKSFNRIHMESNPELSWIAVLALERLGMEPAVLRASSGASGSSRATGRMGGPSPAGPGAGPGSASGSLASEGGNSQARTGPAARSGTSGKTSVPKPSTQASPADWKAADAAVKQGLKSHRKKKYKKALVAYEKALKRVPAHTKALYNAAAALSLLNRIPEAVQKLRVMGATDTKDGYDRLAKARSDKDFLPARSDEGFKEVTGYARVLVLNSLGEYGEDEVERIQEYVEEAGYTVVDVRADRLENRPAPVIWHQPGSARNTAYILSRLVNHPKTMLVPIDWETDVDIAISWGDTFEVDPRTGRPIVKSHELEDPEAATKNARKEQNRALREPEKFATDVEHHARTPERLGNEAEGSVKRVERTKDKLESTGKTLEKLGGFGK